MRQRIFPPLNLHDTTITRTAKMPEPALHAYGTDRGPYEDTSSWSPSWGLGNGQLMVSTIDDVAASARSVLGATLISRASERQFVARPPRCRRPSPGSPMGSGSVLIGDWRVQNPYVNNYGGVMAYLPDERLSVSVVSTLGMDAAFDGKNPSEKVLVRIADAIAPDIRWRCRRAEAGAVLGELRPRPARLDDRACGLRSGGPDTSRGARDGSRAVPGPRWQQWIAEGRGFAPLRCRLRVGARP